MALPAFERHQAGVTVMPPLDPRSRPPTTVPRRATRRSGCPTTIRHTVGGLVFPGHVLDRMAAMGAPPSIRPRPDPLRACATMASRVEAGPGRRAPPARSQRTLAGRTARGRSSTSADRLVAVVVGMTDADVLRLVAAAGRARGLVGDAHAGRLSAALQLTASDLDRPVRQPRRAPPAYDLLGPARRRPGSAPAPSSTRTRRRARATSRSNKAVLRRARGAGPAVAIHASTGRRARRCGRGSSSSSARPTRSRSRATRSRAAAVGARRASARRLGAGRARRTGASGRPSRRLISPRALDPRPRPRRCDRAGVHRGQDAGVDDAGRRDRSSCRAVPLVDASTRKPAATSPRLARRLKLRQAGVSARPRGVRPVAA